MSLSASNCTSVTNVQISPSNPSPGDTVTLTWNYTMDNANNHPYAMAVVSDQCTFRPGNTGGQYVVLGNGCLPSSGQVSGGCDLGTNVPMSASGSKTITIPTGLTPGTTYYVAVAIRDYNVYANPGLSFDREACTSFTIPLPAPYITLSKIAEGTSASPGGRVLYTVYYDFANTNNVVITDVVDPQMSIVSVYDGGTASGNTITWSFPGFTGAPKKGFVSYLAQVGGGVANNTVIPNVATASSAEVPSASSNNATVTVAGVGLALAKSVTPSTAVAGNTVTYTLAYTASGQALWEYENFNSGAVPAGWVPVPDGGTNAVWSAAGGYLHSVGSLGSFYPAIKDTNMAPIHDAVYTYDTQVRSDSNFFDSVFRFNIDPANDNNFYMAVLETDNQWINIYRQPSHSSVCLVNNPNGLTLQSDTWYTVKIEVICNQFKVKVWLRDSAEPAAWSTTGTDSTYSAGGLVGFQVDNGPSYYDNLKVFSLQGGTNVRVWDSVPVGSTYLPGSCTGGTGCSESGGVITWPVGGACSNSGTLTFKATVNSGYSCGQMLSNTASIDSDDPPPKVDSNTVGTALQGFCSTRTPTPTPSVTATASPTPSATPSATPSRTPTDTPTLSPTPSATPSATLSRTPTDTPTLSFTASPPYTITVSPTITPSFTATPSASPTATHTPQYTPTSSPTVTATFSPSQTRTATATLTPSPSITPSFTETPTYTISPTFTETRTPIEQGTLIEIRAIYPTPFKDEGSIYYYLRKPAFIKLAVYDVAGEPVHLRDLGLIAPGKQVVVWKGDNDAGGRCASGAYVLRMEAQATDDEKGDAWARAAISR